jgi:hypothetical protein
LKVTPLSRKPVVASVLYYIIRSIEMDQLKSSDNGVGVIQAASSIVLGMIHKNSRNSSNDSNDDEMCLKRILSTDSGDSNDSSSPAPSSPPAEGESLVAKTKETILSVPVQEVPVVMVTQASQSSPSDESSSTSSHTTTPRRRSKRQRTPSTKKREALESEELLSSSNQKKQSSAKTQSPQTVSFAKVTTCPPAADTNFAKKVVPSNKTDSHGMTPCLSVPAGGTSVKSTTMPASQVRANSPSADLLMADMLNTPPPASDEEGPSSNKTEDLAWILSDTPSTFFPSTPPTGTPPPPKRTRVRTPFAKRPNDWSPLDDDSRDKALARKQGENPHATCAEQVLAESGCQKPPSSKEDKPTSKETQLGLFPRDRVSVLTIPSANLKEPSSTFSEPAAKSYTEQQIRKEQQPQVGTKPCNQLLQQKAELIASSNSTTSLQPVTIVGHDQIVQKTKYPYSSKPLPSCSESMTKPNNEQPAAKSYNDQSVRKDKQPQVNTKHCSQLLQQKAKLLASSKPTTSLQPVAIVGHDQIVQKTKSPVSSKPLPSCSELVTKSDNEQLLPKPRLVDPKPPPAPIAKQPLEPFGKIGIVSTPKKQKPSSTQEPNSATIRSSTPLRRSTRKASIMSAKKIKKALGIKSPPASSTAAPSVAAATTTKEKESYVQTPSDARTTDPSVVKTMDMSTVKPATMKSMTTEAWDVTMSTIEGDVGDSVEKAIPSSTRRSSRRKSFSILLGHASASKSFSTESPGGAEDPLFTLQLAPGSTTPSTRMKRSRRASISALDSKPYTWESPMLSTTEEGSVASIDTGDARPSKRRNSRRASVSVYAKPSSLELTSQLKEETPNKRGLKSMNSTPSLPPAPQPSSSSKLAAAVSALPPLPVGPTPLRRSSRRASLSVRKSNTKSVLESTPPTSTRRSKRRASLSMSSSSKKRVPLDFAKPPLPEKSLKVSATSKPPALDFSKPHAVSVQKPETMARPKVPLESIVNPSPLEIPKATCESVQKPSPLVIAKPMSTDDSVVNTSTNCKEVKPNLEATPPSLDQVVSTSTITNTNKPNVPNPLAPKSLNIQASSNISCAQSTPLRRSSRRKSMGSTYSASATNSSSRKLHSSGGSHFKTSATKRRLLLSAEKSMVAPIRLGTLEEEEQVVTDDIQASMISDAALALFLNTDIKNQPCASARIFSSFALSMGSQKTKVTDNGSVPASIQPLMAFLKSLVRVEMVSLEERDDKANKRDGRRVHFSGFDCSSIKPPVDSQVGSDDHQKDCIAALISAVQQMKALTNPEPENRHNLPLLAQSIKMLVRFLNHLSSDQRLLEECSRVSSTQKLSVLSFLPKKCTVLTMLLFAFPTRYSPSRSRTRGSD